MGTFYGITVPKYSKRCIVCGKQQIRGGHCWDNGKCSVCFNKETMKDIVSN